MASSGSEDAEQTALFGEIASGLQDGRYPPELALLYAIPNGGSRGDNAKSRAIRGAKLKATGVKPGVPDMFWSVAKVASDNMSVFHGLYIELKRQGSDGQKKGVLADAQIELHPKLREQGYCVVTCYGWKAALEALQTYYMGKMEWKQSTNEPTLI